MLVHPAVGQFGATALAENRAARRARAGWMNRPDVAPESPQTRRRRSKQRGRLAGA
jgi:hypothetical protein